MSISDETIRKVVDVIGDLPGYTDEQVRKIALDLADAGLLAPAPLREEWGVPGGDGTTVWNHYLNREEARIGAGDDPVVHRWVTEWETP